MTDDDRPWEQPGAIRRDWEPHRAGLLNGLIIPPFLSVALSLFLPLVSCVPAGGVIVFVCFVISLFGVAGAAAVWVAARHDLAKMDANLMDTQGRRGTRTAADIARVCLILHLLAWLLSVPGIIARFPR
ncbi:MAG TPA: hypothetical protein VFW33_19025 [Gemmataceae bacterium]|nr:hypothetical protein [Gemmataceae bacterium]